ncbi:MAG: 2-hydroxyacyl-CoA dehydratase [Deltaproteobacteria bacterium]|nr:2-hydroxyacyl-CoA dehydratase [Deltaproteobacteria bacterium]
MKTLMSAHWALSSNAHRLRIPIAWVTSGAPIELLRAMGVMPLYPENYAALVAARRGAEPLLEAAEAAGWSQDLCSYAKIDIGSVLRPDLAPLGGLPKPDMLIACNNICQTVTKWWEALGELLDVPVFLLDTPFRAGLMGEARIDYVRSQFTDLVTFVEEHGGHRFSERALRRTIGLSRKALDLWDALMDHGRVRPAPLNGADRFILMAPIVNLRGTQAAVQFYRAVWAESRLRMLRGTGAVPSERFRLLWDDIAVWPALFKLSKIFAERGCSFPVDTYTTAWSGDFTDTDILRGLSRGYSDIFLNWTTEEKMERMIEMARDFHLDGLVIHSNRSCKPYSLGQLEARRRIVERTGLPVLVLEADMADPRLVNLDAWDRQVAAFVEVLESRRRSS